MKILTCLITALVCLNACQPKNTNNNTDSTAAGTKDTTVAIIPAGSGGVFYKHLKGTLAGQPVTMELISLGNGQYSAWYYYDKVGDPIPLLTSNMTDSLNFTEYGAAEEPNELRGTLSANGSYKGTWSGGGRAYPFDLHEAADSSIRFSVASYTDSAALFPGREGSPVAHASSSTVWPSGGADEAALVFIRNTIAPKLDNNDSPKVFLKKDVDDFLKEYRGNNKDVDSNDLKEHGFSWNWEQSGSYTVVFNEWPLLALENFSSAFTGGAHGNYGSSFIALDLAGKKVLKPSDVFKPGYKKALSAALDKSFRKKYKIPAGQPLSEQYLFKNTIEPNDNFYVSKKGVVFSYTPYEIGPYAVGQITLFIPFSDIRGIVKDTYLQ